MFFCVSGVRGGGGGGDRGGVSAPWLRRLGWGAWARGGTLLASWEGPAPLAALPVGDGRSGPTCCRGSCRPWDRAPPPQVSQIELVILSGYWFSVWTEDSWSRQVRRAASSCLGVEGAAAGAFRPLCWRPSLDMTDISEGTLLLLLLLLFLLFLLLSGSVLSCWLDRRTLAPPQLSSAPGSAPPRSAGTLCCKTPLPFIPSLVSFTPFLLLLHLLSSFPTFLVSSSRSFSTLVFAWMLKEWDESLINLYNNQ